MIVKAFFSHVIFSLWSQTAPAGAQLRCMGETRLLRALFPGPTDWGAAPDGLRVGRVWTSQAPAGTGRDCSRGLYLEVPALRPASASLNVRGGSGINRSPHNCLTFYQINRFGSELVTEADAGIDVISLVAWERLLGTGVRRVGLDEAVSHAAGHLRVGYASVHVHVTGKAPVEDQRDHVLSAGTAARLRGHSEGAGTSNRV